ncbi:MAG: DUF6320 domain-containing protein [Spirochaetota bacterium]
MTKCKNCGVMIEDGLDECPLCGEPVTEEARRQKETQQEQGNALRPGASVEPEDENTVRSAKIWLFEMVSLVAFTAGIVIFAADFAFDFALSWSLYPLLAIGFVYLVVAALIGFVRTPVVLLSVETAIVAGFLLLLDLLIGEQAWFLELGLPITLLVALVTGVVAFLISRLRLNALQGVAVGLLGAGFLVVGMEFVINRALRDELVVSWSLIAFACTLSLFFLILFINKRLRERHAEFRKIFHV